VIAFTLVANCGTRADTYAVGLAEQRTTTYERQAGTNFLLSVTDHMGRKTAYTYDSANRITQVTRLADTAEAVSTQYGYSQDCDCDDVTSVTDPLNHTATFAYNEKHNLIAATDPLNNATTYTYNSAGRPLSAKDALNNTTQLTYDNGDLVAVTDARGQTLSAFIDSAGRLLSSRSPLGQSSRYEYDSLDRVVKATDPLGGISEFTYDANGNVLSFKDARNNLTSYTYDTMNRLKSRTDALQHVETFEYDAIGTLKKSTDRRGKVTSYGYDNLYRLTFVGFGTTGDPGNPSYESTISYTYDTVGRLTEVTDSVSGSITYTYDNFDRMLSKTTPQGTITYTYDAAGRKTSMTVAGQSSVNYTYDNANRLTQISQGTNTVSFAYDTASRVISVSRSNGIVIEYGYDAASNPISVTFKKDTTVLGNLTYEYDADGKRAKTGGTFARTGLPQSLTSTTYNAGNQQQGAANFTYDNNGNLTSDGNNTYTWNARNQLASMSGPGMTANFQYDASGNRVTKTINGVSTNYLYDGANIVQELSGTSPTANLLNGGVDKVLTRSDGAGTRTPLTDLQGSVVALADDTGTLQTEYTYDPFGNTTSSGASSASSSKYTGREDDATGLYYYRARYYSPSLQRFISEDPIGLGGGDANFYAYVGNDPINSVDPSGLCGSFQLDRTRPDLQDYARSVYQGRLGRRLSMCINSVFSKVITDKRGRTGRGSDFLDYQQIWNAPFVDDSKTKAELAKDGVPAYGGTKPLDWTKGPFGTVSIASDIHNEFRVKDGVEYHISAFELYQRTYVHELGNLLSSRISQHSDMTTFGDPNGIPGFFGATPDRDTGANLERCVFGNVVP
jgi:RHS repeat-associated protein